jgi:hypothetical protein
VSDILYNPPSLRKPREIFTNERTVAKFSFLPQDFFFKGEEIIAFAGGDIQIDAANIKTHLEIACRGYTALSYRRAHPERSFVLHEIHGSQYLYFREKVYDITASRFIEGIAFILDDLYRFSRQKDKLLVERASLLEDDPPELLWQKEHFLSEKGFDRVLINEEGIVLVRYAEHPLPGSYIYYIDAQTGKRSREIYLATRLGHCLYSVAKERIHVLAGGGLYSFDLQEDKEEKINIDMHIRSIASLGEEIFLIDFNNFLHVYKKGKKEGEKKLPGNFFLLKAKGDELYMADRKDSSIKAFMLQG